MRSTPAPTPATTPMPVQPSPTAFPPVLYHTSHCRPVARAPRVRGGAIRGAQQPAAALPTDHLAGRGPHTGGDGGAGRPPGTLSPGPEQENEDEREEPEAADRQYDGPHTDLVRLSTAAPVGRHAPGRGRGRRAPRPPQRSQGEQAVASRAPCITLCSGSCM
jgi:hypothetical protein